MKISMKYPSTYRGKVNWKSLSYFFQLDWKSVLYSSAKSWIAHHSKHYWNLIRICLKPQSTFSSSLIFISEEEEKQFRKEKKISLIIHAFSTQQRQKFLSAQIWKRYFVGWLIYHICRCDRAWRLWTGRGCSVTGWLTSMIFYFRWLIKI